MALIILRDEQGEENVLGTVEDVQKRITKAAYLDGCQPACFIDWVKVMEGNKAY